MKLEMKTSWFLSETAIIIQSYENETHAQFTVAVSLSPAQLGTM